MLRAEVAHSSRHDVRYFLICLTATVTKVGDETKPVRFGGGG